MWKLMRRVRRRLTRELYSIFDLDQRVSELRLFFRSDEELRGVDVSLPITAQDWEYAAINSSFIEKLTEKADRFISTKKHWSFDEFSQKQFPNKHFVKIRFSISGDAGERLGDFMFPNEVNKHGWAPLLATTFKLTGDRRYLTALQDSLNDWRLNFRVGWGVPYLTTLNVAQRLINWVIAYRVLSCCEPLPLELLEWLSRQAYKEFLFLSKHNTSYYQIRNNYVFCEAAALILYLKTFPNTPDAEVTRQIWSARIIRECFDQIDSDGFTREGSLAYSRFIGECLLITLIFGESAVKPALEKIAKSLGMLVDREFKLPAFGDASSERILDLGFQTDILSSKSFLAATDYYISGGSNITPSAPDAEYFMLTGQTGEERKTQRQKLQSYFFDVGKYGVSKRRWGHLIIDCSEIGLLGTGGHGHCDIGSFCMQDLEGPIIVDPGTFLYSSNRKIRNLYRSSSMHNVTQLGSLEICKLSASLFGVEDAPRVLASASIQKSFDKFFVHHEGFISPTGRIPMSRVISSSDEKIVIEDEWGIPQKAYFRLHFAPGLDVKIRNDVCVVSRNKKRICQIELPTDCDAVIKNYGCSNYYGVTADSKKLSIETVGNGVTKISVCILPA